MYSNEKRICTSSFFALLSIHQMEIAHEHNNNSYLGISGMAWHSCRNEICHAICRRYSRIPPEGGRNDFGIIIFYLLSFMFCLCLTLVTLGNCCTFHNNKLTAISKAIFRIFWSENMLQRYHSCSTHSPSCVCTSTCCSWPSTRAKNCWWRLPTSVHSCLSSRVGGCLLVITPQPLGICC